jgi:hypothetical protein
VRFVRSGWLWGVPAAVALAIPVAFLAAGLKVDTSAACRTSAFIEARERAVQLLNVAGWTSMLAVIACLLGIIFGRGLRIRFLGGLVASVLVLAWAVLDSFGVQVKCAVD